MMPGTYKDTRTHTYNEERTFECSNTVYELRQDLPNNAVGHRYALTPQYLHTNRIPRSHKSS